MTMSPTLVFMTALALVASAAAAQTIKPGLWESTSKVGGNPELDKMMAKMQKQMAGMPRLVAARAAGQLQNHPWQQVRDGHDAGLSLHRP